MLRGKAFLASVLRGNPFLRRLALKHRISDEYPTFLHFEPTNRCNLKCVFCPRDVSTRKLGDMSMDTLQNGLDDSLRHGVRDIIAFQKDGEPLLHKGLGDIISHVKKSKAAKILHMATNAILLDEGRGETVIRSGLDDMLVSLDAATRETYTDVKGVDAFDKVEQNVRAFMALRKKLRSARPFVRVKIINMQGTSQEVTDFKARWRGIADWVEVREFVPWGPVEDKSAKDYSRSVRYPCPYLWYAAAINWDGTVSICCGDFECQGVVGDVNKESLYDIWHSEKMEKMRRAHLEGRYEDVPVCAKCQVWLQEEDIGPWLRKKYKRR